VQITIKLFASFRTGRFHSEVWERPAGTTVRAIAAELDIGEAELGVVAVNARHVRADHVLENGDTCALFPVIGGG